jgi:hypothetical protein
MHTRSSQLIITVLLLLLLLTCCNVQAPGDEAVWRQILRLHLNHSDHAVVQQAAAALAE